MKKIITLFVISLLQMDFAVAMPFTYGVYTCNVSVSAKMKTLGFVWNYTGNFSGINGEDEASALTFEYDPSRGNFFAAWNERSNLDDFGGMSLTLEENGSVRNDDVTKRGIYTEVVQILAQNKQVCFPKGWTGGEVLGKNVIGKGQFNQESNFVVLKGNVVGRVNFGQCIDVGPKKKKRNGGYADLTVNYDCILAN